MTRVVLDSLVRRIDRVAIVDGASIEVQPGELTVVVGPPRAGKTALARLIAGLDPADEGEIYFDGRVMNRTPPAQRRVGLVFQRDALWPHLTVAQQVGYPLKLRGVPRRERRQRVARALGDARMDASADRLPAELPGLLKRRAALARALVDDPEVLVLDEPFGPLEPRERDEFRDEIRRVHAERSLTTFLMTREPREALRLADRLALMDLGRVVQDGAPAEVYALPATPFVADFLGEANLLPGRVEVPENRGSVIIRTAIGRLVGRESPRAPVAGMPVDAAVTAVIRPEAILLGTPVPPDSNRFSANIIGQEFQGPTCRIDLIGPGDWRFSALVLRTHAEGLRTGMGLTASFAANQVLVLPGGGEGLR